MASSMTGYIPFSKCSRFGYPVSIRRATGGNATFSKHTLPALFRCVEPVSRKPDITNLLFLAFPRFDYLEVLPKSRSELHLTSSDTSAKGTSSPPLAQSPFPGLRSLFIVNHHGRKFNNMGTHTTTLEYCCYSCRRKSKVMHVDTTSWRRCSRHSLP